MTDLTTLTPVEIDTVLAEIWGRLNSAQARLDVLSNHLKHLVEALNKSAITGYSAHYSERDITTAEARRDAVLTEVNAIKAEAAPYEAEYDRRPWTRAFLVLNTGGHIHSTRSCSTCFWDTRFGWLPQVSGFDEDEIVEQAGSDACTVCYPNAPVVKRARTLLHSSEVDAQVERDKRAARKAEIAAKREKNAVDVRLTNPNALDKRLRTVTAAKAFLTDGFAWGWAHSFYTVEDQALVASALAEKNGTTPEIEIEAACKRAAKRK